VKPSPANAAQKARDGDKQKSPEVEPSESASAITRAVEEPAEAIGGGPPPAWPAADSVRIRVTVPEGAKVFVNDTPTTSVGAYRSYVVQELSEDTDYIYFIRVEAEVDGRTVSQTKAVEITSGKGTKLDFSF